MMFEYILFYIVCVVNIDVLDGSVDIVWFCIFDEYSGLFVYFVGMLLCNDDVDLGYICFKEVFVVFFKLFVLIVEVFIEFVVDNLCILCIFCDVIDEILSVYLYYINVFSDEMLVVIYLLLIIQDVIDIYSRNWYDDNNGVDICFFYYNDMLILMFIWEEGYDLMMVFNVDSVKVLDDYFKLQMSLVIKYVVELGELLYCLFGNYVVLLDEVVYQ